MSRRPNWIDSTAWDSYRETSIAGLTLLFVSSAFALDLDANMPQQHKMNTEFNKSHMKAFTLEEKQRTLEVEGWRLETPVSVSESISIASVVLPHQNKGKVECNRVKKCQWCWVISSAIDSKDVSPGRSKIVSFRLGSRPDGQSIQFRDPSGKSHTVSVYLGGVIQGEDAILSTRITTGASNIKRAFLAEEMITVIGQDGNPMCEYYTGVVKIVVFKKRQEKTKRK